MTNQSPAPSALFFALGDPTRLAVVQRLCRGPASVSELARPFDMALPSFVQHLKVLEESRWILSSKQGRIRTCQINPETLEAAGGWLEEQRNLWTKRMDQLDRYLIQQKRRKRNERRGI